MCLQPCMHPVRLECSHIFCFLCVKGVAIQRRKCPMCRRPISPGFFSNPNLLQLAKSGSPEAEAHKWFYEGRNGWWEYDKRTAEDLETAFQKSQIPDENPDDSERETCELLIAGFLYTIDFEDMVQHRRNEPHKRRRIKRDVLSNVENYKGVAGLRLNPDPRSSRPSTSSTDSRPSVDALSQDLGSLNLDQNSQS